MGIRWILNSGLLSRPSLPSSFTFDEFLLLELKLLSLNFFLLPFIGSAVLCARVLDFCLAHCPISVDGTRLRRLRLNIWLQWAKARGLTFTKVVDYICFCHIGILWNFTGSVMAAGYAVMWIEMLLSEIPKSPSRGASLLGFYFDKVIFVPSCVFGSLFSLAVAIFMLFNSLYILYYMIYSKLG